MDEFMRGVLAGILANAIYQFLYQTISVLLS
jgi:hypothetical protein